MKRDARIRPATVCGLIVALGWPFALPLWYALRGQTFTENILDTGSDVTSIIAAVAAAAVVMSIVVFWERLPLASIGVRAPKGFDLLAALATLLVVYIAAAAFSGQDGSASAPNKATPAMFAAVPLGIRLLLVLTAGFAEELTFRAYTIERFGALTGKMWIGGALSVTAFTTAHLWRYGGVTAGLLLVFIFGAGAAVLYIWRRNFWACAILHVTVDAISLIIMPAFARP